MNTEVDTQPSVAENKVEGGAPLQSFPEGQGSTKKEPCDCSSETQELGQARKDILSQFVSSGSLKRSWPMVAAQMRCSRGFAYEKLQLLKERGVENVRASEMLKKSAGTKLGDRRLGDTEQKLTKAIRTAIVDEGYTAGTRRANQRITELLRADGCSRLPSRKLMTSRSRDPWVANEKMDPYKRDHWARVSGDRLAQDGLMSLCVGDVTQFTNDEYVLRVFEEFSEGVFTDLGSANAYFFLLGSNRAIWSGYPFVGPPNRRLAGLSIHLGLIDKRPFLQELGISARWQYHGMVGRIHHDRGKDFIADDVVATLKDIGIPIVDRSPPKTPNEKGDIERFNRTAHLLFREFLESEECKRVVFKDPKHPNWICIRWRDYRRAFYEWVIRYNNRPHAALGTKSPNESLEDFALGRNGWPKSGLPHPVVDSEALQFDFLCREDRVLKHTGIHIWNRCYKTPDLAQFFELDARTGERTRSSGNREFSVRYDPYRMGCVVLEHPDTNPRMPADARKFIRVRWVLDSNQRIYDREKMLRLQNCSLWEWEAGYAALRDTYLSAENPISEAQVVAQVAHRIEALGPSNQSSSHPKKPEMRQAQRNTMRNATGSAVDKILPPDAEKANRWKKDSISPANPPHRPTPIATKLELSSLYGHLQT